MIPGILLDRDGTIIVDYHYVGHIERVQFIPGAIEAIRRFNQAGIPVAIVTNQGGVARGFYPEENVLIVHDYIKRELRLHGAHIDAFFYSPDHPEGSVKEYANESDDHKPNTGMARDAAWALNIDLTKSIVVGDRETDMQFARNIGAHGVYLGTEPLPEAEWDGIRFHYNAVQFPSLGAAAGYIIERITGMSNSEFPTMSYQNASSYFYHYADEVRDATLETVAAALDAAAVMLMRACDDGSEVFIAGNGGSAAIANHLETDLIKRLTKEMGWYTDIHSLCTNQSLLTAIANDIGYDAVFSYQLEKHAVQRDLLIAFSVSGQSPNILRALQCARELGMETILVAAQEGGKLGSADVTIHIPTNNYGVAEDVMMMIAHALAQYLQQSRMPEHVIQSTSF